MNFIIFLIFTWQYFKDIGFIKAAYTLSGTICTSGIYESCFYTGKYGKEEIIYHTVFFNFLKDCCAINNEEDIIMK